MKSALRKWLDTQATWPDRPMSKEQRRCNHALFRRVTRAYEAVIRDPDGEWYVLPTMNLCGNPECRLVMECYAPDIIQGKIK